MDIIIATSVFLEQVNQLNNQVSNLNSLAFQATDIVSKDTDPDSVRSRIAAIVSSSDVQLTAIGAQTVLVQQAVDELAKLVK